jgi:hypothetical protein
MEEILGLVLWAVKDTKIMRGISRSSVFKANSRESSFGVALASLPAGVDSSITPVIVGADVLLHNPKNLSGGSVTPATSMSPNLRENITAAATRLPVYPTASVSCTVFAVPNENVYVYAVYSKSNQFDNDVKEQGINSFSGAGVVFHLSNLDAGATYYLKIFARYKNKNSVWSNSPIIINVPVAPTNGLFGSTYYISGQPTTLSSSGKGESNGVFYINGQPTNLSWSSTPYWSGWTGVHEGLQYYEGLVAQGYINGDLWLDGVQVSEQYYQTGTGMIEQIYYNNYIPYTGYTDGNYYLNGVASDLDVNGSGEISGTYYQNGAPLTGSSGAVYYVDGQPTTLSSNGTGVWNGQFYSAGAYIGSVGNPYDFGGAFAGATFRSGLTYG